MADPFVAEIRIFPFNFAPRGWAWCDGQLLPLSPEHRAVLAAGHDLRRRREIDLRPTRPARPCADAPRPGAGTVAARLGRNGGKRDRDTPRIRDSRSQPRAASRDSASGTTATRQVMSLARPPGATSTRPRRRTAGLDVQPSPHPRRRRPAAQQPAAVPDLLLQYRAPGGISAERIGQRSGTILTTTRYLPFL